MHSRIREIEGLDPRSLPDEILKSTQPLLLRGLAKTWPIVQSALVSDLAAKAYLKRFYRGSPVMAMLGTPAIEGRFFYNDDLSGFNFFPARTSLDLVFGELEDHKEDKEPPAIYVGSTAVDSCLPGFRSENDLELGDHDPLMSIWIGNATRIAAHYDCPDNIACVVAGHRRFTLFPPEQLSNLYVGPIEFTPAGQSISLVDFLKPDFVKFPKFSEALKHAQVAELAPGDAILSPSMWWHHVEALDRFNVLVNYWWRQTPDFMGTPTSAMMMAMLAIRDLPREQRLAWQEHFRHYVFEADGLEAAHIIPSARGVMGPFDVESAHKMQMQIKQKMNQ
nr:cupin-like domain-containing protein [uncultured Undibacterium sp.]